jgi:hypothetical protein
VNRPTNTAFPPRRRTRASGLVDFLVIDDPVRQLAQHGVAVPPGHLIPHAVADDRAADPGDQHTGQAHPVLVSQHTAQQHPDLAGDEKAGEERTLGEGQQEHDEQSGHTAQAQDQLEQAVDHIAANARPAAPLPAAAPTRAERAAPWSLSSAWPERPVRPAKLAGCSDRDRTGERGQVGG